MKTVEITVTGNSLLAYVTLYDEDILEKLNDIEQFDFVDFRNGHEKKSVFLGRGFCETGSLTSEVSVDSVKIFNGDYFWDEDYQGETYEEKIATIKEEDNVDYESCLIAPAKESLDISDHYLTDVDKFKYCSLETVQCYKSVDKIIIEAEDDFKITDLDLILIDTDSGGRGSLEHSLYSYTNLEKQVLGVKYKGQFFEFLGGNDEGGSNEIYWFERNGDTWAETEAIHERIDELDAW